MVVGSNKKHTAWGIFSQAEIYLNNCKKVVDNVQSVMYN